MPRPAPEAFRSAAPFPCALWDDFLPAETLAALGALFPLDPRGDGRWRAGVHRHSRKWTCADAGVRSAVEWTGLLSAEFLRWLEAASGIAPLVADPALKGGGLHLSLPGSYLDLHCDFTVHEALGMRRALNLLIYLTPDYAPAWGGALELWSFTHRDSIVTIWPRENRAVLFATSDHSWHGHPEPMQGPAHAQRRSLALYYYTPWRAGDPRLPTTVYRARPWEWGERLRMRLGRIKRAVCA